jgi:hypothetical protein
LNNVDTAERIRKLELENTMLRRMVGSGTGKTGRPPAWSAVQMTHVRELRAAGRSLRDIARETHLPTNQVRTILNRAADRPHPETEKATRRAARQEDLDADLVRRVQGLSHVIAGGKAIVARDRRKKAVAQKIAKEAARRS